MGSLGQLKREDEWLLALVCRKPAQQSATPGELQDWHVGFHVHVQPSDAVWSPLRQQAQQCVLRAKVPGGGETGVVILGFGSGRRLLQKKCWHNKRSLESNTLQRCSTAKLVKKPCLLSNKGLTELA